MPNHYCKILRIEPPRLESVKDHPDANFYSLLIVVLLERGGPVTLEEVAARFEEAGIAPAAQALQSLKRCKPGRPPIYRDGDLYCLDPEDGEADLWTFRLGLRPPSVPQIQVVRPDAGPLPTADLPLTVAALDEAWRYDLPEGWSAQRVAICVLDAGGGAMQPRDVVGFVQARSRWCPVTPDSTAHWRAGAPIRALADGSWELDRGHAAVRSAREAVRERIAVNRRTAHLRPDPAVIEVACRHRERQRAVNAQRLAGLRRVLLHAFPAKDPGAIVLLDINRREIATFDGANVDSARQRLLDYDCIVAVGVRSLLRILDVDPADRRLEELGPPQKTIRLDSRGRTLGITTAMLIQGSCGISRPLGDARLLRDYLRAGDSNKLRRRLEADAKNLLALHQYGRLHSIVRLRWGLLEERTPAPWQHRDEPTLYDLMKRGLEEQLPLEVIVGSAPGWADPWSRKQRATVHREQGGWRMWLAGEDGVQIHSEDVQLARLCER